jgi:hypothetical protein
MSTFFPSFSKLSNNFGSSWNCSLFSDLMPILSAHPVALLLMYFQNLVTFHLSFTPSISSHLDCPPEYSSHFLFCSFMVCSPHRSQNHPSLLLILIVQTYEVHAYPNNWVHVYSMCNDKIRVNNISISLNFLFMYLFVLVVLSYHLNHTNSPP